MMTRGLGMTDDSVANRTKRWAGRRHAIRYRWHERWSDWWCATRDARSGIPATAVSPEEGSPAPPPFLMTKLGHRASEPVWGTPRTVALGQLGRGRAELEWIRFQAETAGLQVERGEAAARQDAAAARLAAVKARLGATKPLSKEESMAPAAGEERADEAVRVGRRNREHAARTLALNAEVRQHSDAADAAGVQLARLVGQIRIRREVAEVRVALIEAYVRHRCSAYLTRLVRKHPDGKRLGSLIRSHWTEQPSWLADAATTRDGGA